MKNNHEELKFAGFITVRSSSNRLPRKCFLPFGENENVLTHVINRSKYFGIETIICTSNDSLDDEIEEIANNMEVKIFRGSLKNKLKRWADCANHFGINTFHTIDADDPFFDGNLMRKSMELLAEKELDCVCPTTASSNGSASVGYSLTSKIVNESIKDLSEDEDTEMMWYFLEKIKNIKMEELVDDNEFEKKVRLTLDYEEDYWLLSFLKRLLGTYASREQINNLFAKNPDLAKINLFRNDEWKKAQLDKKI
tara:strand:+ start:623 stop:1381 length:759 start_codon:yes stop_codon:yes gene_type:complete